LADTRVYVSYDYDHDDDLKTLLVGQSKNPDSPFTIADQSIKTAIEGDWKASARRRIKGADVMAVICGQHTDTATGVAHEVTIAQEERIPYFLLAGRASGGNKRPTTAKASDKLYSWTWEHLKTLVKGGR
jgi:Thoeris protein ThsB, TIR-like domain